MRTGDSSERLVRGESSVENDPEKEERGDKKSRVEKVLEVGVGLARSSLPDEHEEKQPTQEAKVVDGVL
jgi:hypothetical protein